MNKFIKLLPLIFIISCASKSYQQAAPYKHNVEIWTKSEKSYEGINNTIQASVTFLHPDLLSSQLAYRGELYGWDSEKQKEQSAIEQDLTQKKARFFLAFYTPDRKLNNLEKSKTPWRIFLDVEGRRYPAEIKRNRTTPVELRTLYSHLTQWHTAYDMEFPVTTSFLKGKTFNIQISGPGGQQVFTFSYL